MWRILHQRRRADAWVRVRIKQGLPFHSLTAWTLQCLAKAFRSPLLSHLPKENNQALVINE